MKPFARFALVCASAALAGCPPSLSGEPCQTDCNCPSGQTCAPGDGGSTCQSGENICPFDAGTLQPGDGGSDAGEGEGLFGKVTLNGGLTKPASNDAWVLAFAGRLPGDGGPDFTVATDSAGNFSFPLAHSGINYYLVAEYDIVGDGREEFPSSAHRYSSAGPLMLSTSAAEIDVVTYDCATLVVTAAIDAGPQLVEARADVRDVQTGAELQSGATVTVSSAMLGTQTLQFQQETMDTFSSNLWAYFPSSLARPAPEASYQFSVTAPFYNGAICTVARTPPPGFPSALAITTRLESGANVWSTQATTDTVSWKRVSGSVLDVVTLFDDTQTVGTANKNLAQVSVSDGGDALDFPGSTVPMAACPLVGTSDCDLNVTSLFDTVSGNARSVEVTGANLLFRSE